MLLQPVHRQSDAKPEPCAPSSSHRYLLDDPDPERFQSHYFARMIRQQPDIAQSKIGEDLSADPRFMLKPPLAIHCRKRLMFPEARPGLMQIHQHARALRRDPFERSPNGRLAFTFNGPEHVARDAVGMHPD